MFDSLTGLIPLAWRLTRGQARFAGSHDDASQADDPYRQRVRHPAAVGDPTAPIRVPLNWLPTPEQPSPTRPEASATR
jgi:hypothetical protein